jgi:hypothetical protein
MNLSLIKTSVGDFLIFPKRTRLFFILKKKKIKKKFEERKRNEM